MCLSPETPSVVAAAPPADDCSVGSSVDLRGTASAGCGSSRRSGPVTPKTQRRTTLSRTTSDKTCSSTSSEGSADTKCDAVERLSACAETMTRPISRTRTSAREERAARAHPLYLHASRSFTCAPVQFEDGMTLEECDALYRSKRWDTVAIDSPPKRSQREETSPGVARGMLGRLRRLGLAASARSPAKTLDDDDDASSVRTASTRSMSLDSCLSSCSSSSSEDSAAAATAARPRFVLSFSPTVTVHSVPSAALYPRQVYERIWYSNRSWKAQKRSARKEYEYDGEDWRRATEEDKFVRCERTGKKVHPVHARSGRRRNVGAGATARVARTA